MRRLQAACAALLVWAAMLAPALSSAATAVTLEQALVVASEAGRPADVDFGRASATALPDNWRLSRPGFDGTAWYSIALDGPLRETGAAGPRGDLVLIVPRVADIGEFWLNGERLDLGNGNGYTRNRTLWVPLRAHTLKPAGNVLQVRVSGNADARGGLSQMTLGPSAAVRPRYEARHFLQTIAPTMLLFAVPICLFGAIPLWFKTRRYIDLLFVFLCLSWMPRALVMLAPTAGTPGPGALLFAMASTFISNTLMVMLLLEHSNWTSGPWKRYLKTLYAVIGVSLLAGAVAYAQGELRPAVAGALHWPYFALTFVAVLAQVRRAWQTHGRVDIFMALTLAVWWMAVLQDLAIPADLAPFDAFFLAPVAALMVLATLVARTLQGLALTRGNADHEINRAVAGERQAVLAAERTRLLHDLHDGMGSQLITALRMTRRDEVPREEVARVIEDSLEDMRLIIDSLDLEEPDLLQLLAGLRYRMEPRLRAIGVALVWDVEPLPQLDYLSPESGLAIVRIVQEAVNNALRHGHARTITVRARGLADSVELSIADDGCGFDADAGRTGRQRGLGTMSARAQKLGGELRVTSGAGGTSVLLSLPLHR